MYKLSISLVYPIANPIHHMTLNVENDNMDKFHLSKNYFEKTESDDKLEV